MNFFSLKLCILTLKKMAICGHPGLVLALRVKTRGDFILVGEDSVSKFLRDNNIHAKSYHSGLPAKDRKQTQDMFFSNWWLQL